MGGEGYVKSFNAWCHLTVMLYAVIMRYNPFEHAEYEKVEKAIRFLSKSDVKKLMAMKICDSDAELARRMFIFSCFTGLAITDMEHLMFGHIKSAADGQMYIRKERQKTKVVFIVPLHPIAKTIIEQQRQLQAVKEKGLTSSWAIIEIILHSNYILPSTFTA